MFMSPEPAYNELELTFLELTRTRKISEEDISALKNLWARYFMMKATESANKAWQEKGYTKETIQEWIKGEK
jgi:hypothetical protein